ncbi:MAG: acyl-ACP--UDP-N-acetylglucosamine O-acyltransferase, partial [Muribaculaceae bacterium]|nr:acyl-ACP--UDP-N-acetylglucosamine O-acyltransferase [Muribaculaceae bacterium]
LNGTRMGSGNKVYQGAVIGATPQDFRWKGEKTYCFIGNNNVIREHVIINLGINPAGGTHIADENFIMANVHLGHDCTIGSHCVLGNGVTFGGSVKVGDCAILSSNSIMHEGSHIGDWVLVKGGCRISGNVPPYVIVAHNPVSYFGVNAYVMRKGGFDPETIDDIAKAYRHVYQSGTSVFNALKRIEDDVKAGEYRDKIIDFVRAHNLQIVAVPIDLE